MHVQKSLAAKHVDTGYLRMQAARDEGRLDLEKVRKDRNL